MPHRITSPSIARGRISNITIEIQMKYRHYPLAFAAITSALCAQTNTSPQATEASEIYELPPVYVTADLWESELQSTTASVSVLDASQLEIKASEHFDDIINSIPNLTWTGGTSRPRYIQIRGIGENSQYEGETPDSSVRFLIDDIDLTGLGTVGSLFDVQQVEVLRGAQAGAFGANAAGGVVRIVTNDPTPYWSGQVETTVGDDSLFASGLAVGGPLLKNDPEQLTFRIAINQLNQDGFRDNKFLNRDDTNQRDELNTRLKLRWLSSPDWQWDGTLLYANVDNGFDEFSLGNSGFTTYSDEPGVDKQETLGGSLRGTWTGLDDIELLTITSYTTTDSLYSFDGDWGAAAAPAPASSFYTDFLTLDRKRDAMSQEFRLNSKEHNDALGFIDRWTIGVYTQLIDEKSYATWDSGYIWDTDFDSESIALFGQIEHHINDRTRLKLQLRVEHYSVDVAANGLGFDPVTFAPLPFDYALDSSDTLWGGNISLEHDLKDNLMLFASASRGYKAGGASTPNFTAATNITYDKETLWTVEGGLRGNFFDHKMDASLTAFYTYRDNPQFRDSTGSGSFFDYITVNGDSAEHFGLESEATWHFTSDWSFSTSLGLLKADYATYTAAGSINNARGLANAPLYNYSARLSYNPRSGLFGSIEVTGQDEYFESNSHGQERDAFTTVNATIGYRYQNWTFSLWAKNLFDQAYAKRVFFFNNGSGSNERYESPADPQHFGITANYSF